MTTPSEGDLYRQNPKMWRWFVRIYPTWLMLFLWTLHEAALFLFQPKKGAR